MASSTEQFERLKHLLGEARDLDRTANVLEWDQQTYMPPGGSAARAEHSATIERLAHEQYTSPEVGRLLDALEGKLGDYDSDEASIVRINRREYERKRRVPAELVSDLARAKGLGMAAWQAAKSAADYTLFRPHLEQIIDLKRRLAEGFKPADLYDPLLAEYEPGMTAVEVRTLFAELKAGLIPLVRQIAQSNAAIDDEWTRMDYDEKKQWDFGVEIAQRLGFDFNNGRQDVSAHPFTTHFSHDDVRLTTRIMRNYVTSGLFSSIHEAGHGMYEQGVSPALARTWLDEGTSLGVHESQSRLWENHVGRSRAFWQFYFPRLQAAFPEQLAGMDQEMFYRGINRVRPSLIRTEADEVTYSLHVMLRFELEQDMLAGKIDYAQLPAIWTERMGDYVGAAPEDDAEGVLQDIHWSGGLVGYFATYTIGSVLATQFFEQAAKELPGLEAQFAAGEFAPLLGWLREKIYRHGRKYTLGELAQRVTGGPLSAKPYLRYLQNKYQEIYGLDLGDKPSV